uniref:Transcription factor IIIA n=1 Tax=Balaenoptera musculus TaxID=9771 RepID=A0A8C0DDY5_BALMU
DLPERSVALGSRHVAQHVAECLAPGTLEPPASVAEAVSSLTIADAFVAAGESLAPPPPAPAQRFICSFPDCSANYNKAWKLDAHLCKHTGERPFVCDHEGCSKAFVRDWHLSRHALVHTGEKPFVCTASGCDQKFNTKSNLKKHFERKHENQQKQYVCSFEGCKKTFKKHQQLKTHQCQHTNEPPFTCTHEGCGKHFASPSSLKRHGKVHEGYICQKECSFVAKTWTELLKHVREAHKEDITCDVCQKTFKRKDFLKQHMRIHAPERDVCRCPREGCGRTYTTVFNLQSHILSFHEEQRPFVCEHASCGKTFAMKQERLSTKLGEQTDRPCQSCSKSGPQHRQGTCEKCTSRLRSRPTESEVVGMGPVICILTNFPGDSYVTELETQWPLVPYAYYL